MQHLILTRLAIGRPTREWLSFRLDLFERFCAPSVRAQTNRRFRWLLAVHPETPSWFLERALAAATNAILVLQPEKQVSGKHVDWQRIVADVTGGGTILTTWLDSDDLVHSRFVETVQCLAAGARRPLVIDFPSGYQLRYPDLALAAIRCRRPTHFVSLLEDGCETVCYGNHSRIGERFPILRVETEPYWVEICHPMNLLNTYSKAVSQADWHVVKASFVDRPGGARASAPAALDEPGSGTRIQERAVGALGSTFVCPICGVRSNRFLEFGLVPRPNAKCPACHSLERHRLLWLFLRRHTDLFGARPKRVLQLAPEACLSRRLQFVSSVNCLSASPSSRRAMTRGDINELSHQCTWFDIILGDQLLERASNGRLSLRALRRVLRTSGWAAFIGPPAAPETQEGPRVIQPRRREADCGHGNGVKRPAADFVQRLRDCGFKARAIHPFDVASADECRLFSINPRERLYLAIK